MINCSIIVAVYNKLEFLDEFFASLVAQNLDDKEVIFIDDHSTDKSWEKLLSITGIANREHLSAEIEYHDLYLLLKRDNIKLIQLKENSGPSIARRIGIDNATGKFFTCADPDDLIDPGMYDGLIKKAITENADMVWENYFTGRRDGDLLLVRQNYREDPVEILNSMLYGKTNSGAWNKIFRRAFALEHGVNFESERLFVCEDMVFMVNFMRHLPVVRYNDDAHYKHIFYPLSLSHTKKTATELNSLLRIGEILNSWDYPEVCRHGVHLVLERLKVSFVLSPECSKKFAFSAFPEIKKVSLAGAESRKRLFLYDASRFGFRPIIIACISTAEWTKNILRKLKCKIIS